MLALTNYVLNIFKVISISGTHPLFQIRNNI